jgi:regulatory protein
MIVVAIKNGTHPETARIALSDGREFSLGLSYLPPFYQERVFSFTGREISSDEEEVLRFAAACFRAERAALRLVARAEQTGFGISRKLERRGHASACVRAVVARLTESGIVNDRRFAALWIQSRLTRNAESPLHLIRALCSRGIDRDDAAEALKAVLGLEQESALLKRYLEKKYPQETKTYPLKQTLKHEGFSPAVIQSFWEEQS